MGQHLGKKEPQADIRAPSPRPEALHHHDEAAVAEPASAEPASAEPASAEPASAEPASAEPASAEPVSAEPASAEPDSQDEVFGLGGEADVNQNNGGVSEKPAVTDSTGAEGPGDPQPPAAAADDPEGAGGPRPHLVRLFSRDAPGREDNTFKDRPSESDELQTIEENGAECGSESPDQDLE